MSRRSTTRIHPNLRWTVESVTPTRDPRNYARQFLVLVSAPSGKEYTIAVSTETLQSFRKCQKCLLSKYGVLIRHACETYGSVNAAWIDAIQAVLRDPVIV